LIGLCFVHWNVNMSTLFFKLNVIVKKLKDIKCAEYMKVLEPLCIVLCITLELHACYQRTIFKIMFHYWLLCSTEIVSTYTTYPAS